MPTISASPGPVVPCRPCHAGRSGRPGRAPAPEGTDAGRVPRNRKTTDGAPVQQTDAGHAGVIPRRLEDNGRRTCPADRRGACGRVPRNRKTTNATPVQQTDAGHSGARPPETGRQRTPHQTSRRTRGMRADHQPPTWTARRKTKKRSDKFSDLFYSLFFNPFYRIP